MALPEIKIVLTAVGDGARRGIQVVSDSLDGLGGRAEMVGKRLQAIGDRINGFGKKLSIVSAGITAAGAGMFALANSTATAGDRIAKTARAAGVGGEYFQEMAYAIGQVSDLSEDQLGSAMGFLTKRIGEAAQGSKEAASALAELGFSQGEIEGGAISTEAAFSRFIEKMDQSSSPALAAALSADLFGRSAAALGPQLTGAADEIEALRGEAQGLGIILGQDTLDQSEAFNDAMDKLWKSLEGLKNQIGAELIPVLVNTLIPAVQDKVIPALARLVEKIGGLIDWFGNLPAPVQEAAGVIAAALGVGGPIVLAVGTLTKVLGGLIAASGPVGLFIAAAAALVVAWEIWGDDITRIVGEAVDWVTEKFTAMRAFIDENFAAVEKLIKDPVGTALEAWRGFTEDLKTAVGEMVEWVQLKFNELIEFIATIPQQMIDLGGNLIEGLKEGVRQKWEDFKAYMESLFPEIPQWARDILGIQSPSRVFMEIGNYIGEGLAQGIADSQGLVSDAVGVLADSATGATSGMVGDVLGSLGQLFQGSKKFAIAQALINTWQGASEALKLPFPQNLAAFAKVVATGLGAVKNIRSAQPGGGGGGSSSTGGSSAGSGAASGSADQGPLTTYQITLTNDPFGFGEKFARQFIEQLNATSRSGGRVRAVLA